MKDRETLGGFLKRERELRNISLRELAKRTKVREHFLKAMEEDRFDLLPSMVYVKGFLSAYTKSIGIDPQEVLLCYEGSLQGERATAPGGKAERTPGKRPEKKPETESERKPQKKPEKKRERKLFNWLLSNRKQIWVVSGVLAIGLLISYFFHPYLSGPPVELPSNLQKASGTPPFPPDSQPQEMALTIEEKPFSIEIKAIERAWIKIQVNGKPPAEVLLNPGEEVSYQATERIELLIGNAGGIDVIFGGKKMERLGQSGEVVTLAFTPRGVERKKP